MRGSLVSVSWIGLHMSSGFLMVTGSVVSGSGDGGVGGFGWIQIG